MLMGTGLIFVNHFEFNDEYNIYLGLWGLVNNAGWATFGDVEWVSTKNYNRAMDINFNGVILGEII